MLVPQNPLQKVFIQLELLLFCCNELVYSLILWEDHRLLDVTAANLSINQP